MLNINERKTIIYMPLKVKIIQAMSTKKAFWKEIEMVALKSLDTQKFGFFLYFGREFYLEEKSCDISEKRRYDVLE